MTARLPTTPWSDETVDDDEDEADEDEPAVCPKCGGVMVMDSAPGGQYPMALVVCSKCGFIASGSWSVGQAV